MDINFCSQCGAPTRFIVPPGDNQPRFVCGACGFTHYQNPNIVAGCIAEADGKIIMCKRAIEPRRGLWTLPAGFMENGETVAQAARRETWEEARAKVDVGELYALFNLPHANQVYILYRAELQNTDYGPGPESEEVVLINPNQIPAQITWGEIAFPIIAETLKLYITDIKNGRFRFHTGDILRPPRPIPSDYSCLRNAKSR